MNIWEVVCVSDLIKILKDSPLQFVIVGLVLESTPKSIQTEIKRFLKDKAKVFPNMKFLYYKASTKDLGRISLLDKDESQYPYVYHIFDVSNIFIKVTCANKQTIYEAFKAGEQYYVDNLKKYREEKKEKVENREEHTQEDNISKENQSQNNTQNNIQTNSLIENTGLLGRPQNSNHLSNVAPTNTDEWKKQEEELAKQQKLIEKTLTFQQRAKDFNLELLKDIQQRKVEESKNKKK